MSEMIPLSANIFHDPEDMGSRTAAALEVAMASLRRWAAQRDDIEVDGVLKQLDDIKASVLETAPVTYDCRGELVAAFDGRDTRAPFEGAPAEQPMFVIGGSDKTAIFRDEKTALEVAAEMHNAYVTSCTIGDRNPRR